MGLRNSDNSSVESGKLSSKEKKLKRRQELVKKKAVAEAIKAAYAKDDHLAGFPAFHEYERNGLAVQLESGSREHLPSPLKIYIQGLLKVNMEGQYGPDGPAEVKNKRREMISCEACYIFVRKLQNVDDAHLANRNNIREVRECYWKGDMGIQWLHLCSIDVL